MRRRVADGAYDPRVQRAAQLVGYHTAGSFVLHMTERFGLPPVLRFFQTSNREDALDVIRGRIQDVVGVSLDEIENSWLAMLRAG